MVCDVHVCEIEDSTITFGLNKCLQDFLHIGALRKEQKTCLVNLAHGKDVFAILPTGFEILPDHSAATTEQSQEGVINTGGTTCSSPDSHYL